MNKKFFGVALAAVSLFAMSATAQDNKTAQTKTCTQQNCTKQTKERPAAPNPFEGLTLTEQQQTALKAIPCPAMNREQQKKEDKEARKAQREQRAQQAKEAKANYLKQVKSILTPEQYVQFLENNFMNSGMKKGDAPKGMKKGEGPKGMKKDGCKGKKGQCCNKGQRPAPANDAK